MEKTLTAVVTAGRMREPIDDVRGVVNSSSGRLGIEVAKALMQRGVRVTLVLYRDSERDLSELEGIDIVPYRSFADLAAALKRAAESPPDLLFMSAAVADYSPVPTEGKIPSDAETLTLTMTKNPKLLAGLRESLGRKAFIVGFKLVSRSTRKLMREKATGQLAKCRTNLCAANDIALVGRDPERHPMTLFTPEGGEIDIDGTKAEVAAQLADFSLRRHRVRWFKSLRRGDRAGEPTPLAAETLALAQDARLLRDRNGNVSARDPDGGRFWITPRQADKSVIGPESLIEVSTDKPVGHNAFLGTPGLKPSIDAGVHALLYERLPRLRTVMHFHDGLVVPTVTTSFPYPCGTFEEADEICSALAESKAWYRRGLHSFMVELVDHGYLLGLDETTVRYHDMAESWSFTRSDYLEHLRKVGLGDMAEEAEACGDTVRVSPIFVGWEIVGAFAEHLKLGFSSCWLRPQLRGLGYGEKVAELLIRRGCTIGAHRKCGVADWYVRHGYRESGRQGDIVVLEPPTAESCKLKEEVAACLYEPRSRQVLVGRDLRYGRWRLPGGAIRPNETTEACVCRVIEEETGIEAYGRVTASKVFYVGDGKTSRRMTCLVVPTLNAETPLVSDDLSARWLKLDDCLKLKPTAPGTRRTLAWLARHVA